MLKSGLTSLYCWLLALILGLASCLALEHSYSHISLSAVSHNHSLKSDYNVDTEEPCALCVFSQHFSFSLPSQSSKAFLALALNQNRSFSKSVSYTQRLYLLAPKNSPPIQA